MYNTLRPELITATPAQRKLMKSDTTYVVEISMFKQNPLTYFEVHRLFILGAQEKRWKATIAHRFAEILHRKTGKLTRVFTQNIDGLYSQCDGIPSEKIVNVYGTLSKTGCEGCGAEVANFDEFCDEMKSSIKDIYNVDMEAPSKSSPIKCESCRKPMVKTLTILFGSNYSSEFFERSSEDLPRLDLLILAGTSLVMSPVNNIVPSVPDTYLQMILNPNTVGQDLGIDYGAEANRDYFAEGNCDEVFWELCDHLGWIDNLKEFADVLLLYLLVYSCHSWNL